LTNKDDIRRDYGNKTVEALDDILNHAAESQQLLRMRDPENSRIYDLACEAIIIHIGESALRTSQRFREDHPELELNDAISIRNIAAHGYDIIDYETLWTALEHDVPRVAALVEQLLRD